MLFFEVVDTHIACDVIKDFDEFSAYGAPSLFEFFFLSVIVGAAKADAVVHAVADQDLRVANPTVSADWSGF